MVDDPRKVVSLSEDMMFTHGAPIHDKVAVEDVESIAVVLQRSINIFGGGVPIKGVENKSGTSTRSVETDTLSGGFADSTMKYIKKNTTEFRMLNAFSITCA